MIRRVLALVLAAALACAAPAVVRAGQAVATPQDTGPTIDRTPELAQVDLSQGLAQVVQVLTQLSQSISQIASGAWTQSIGQLLAGVGSSTSAFSPISGASPYGGLLGLLQQWLAGALSDAQSAIWSEWGSEWGQAPDYSYSAGTIASTLQQIGGLVGGSAQQWLTALASALQHAPAPAPNSPQAAATALAQQDPVFGGRAHSVQQSQVVAMSTAAVAQAAAEQVGQVAQQATSDTTPSDTAAAAQQIAQQTGAAVQSAPSTRAAVEVMAAGLAQEVSQQVTSQAALASRLDALITQQAQLATVLSQTVAGLGSVSGLLAQELDQQLEDQAQDAVGAQDSQAGALSGLSAELAFLGQSPSSNSFNQFLSGLAQLSP